MVVNSEWSEAVDREWKDADKLDKTIGETDGLGGDEGATAVSDKLPCRSNGVQVDIPDTMTEETEEGGMHVLKDSEI